MKTLYIKIFKCFKYPFHKCMPTKHLNKYHIRLYQKPPLGLAVARMLARFMIMSNALGVASC